MVLKFVLNKACPIISKVAICTEFCQFGKTSNGLVKLPSFMEQYVLFGWFVRPGSQLCRGPSDQTVSPSVSFTGWCDAPLYPGVGRVVR